VTLLIWLWFRLSGGGGFGKGARRRRLRRSVALSGYPTPVMPLYLGCFINIKRRQIAKVIQFYTRAARSPSHPSSSSIPVVATGSCGGILKANLLPAR